MTHGTDTVGQKTDFVGGLTDVADQKTWPTLAHFPVPAKALVTVIIATLALAMTGAIGQVVVHDIIPTFITGADGEKHSDVKVEVMTEPDTGTMTDNHSGRGDLFSDLAAEKNTDEKQHFYTSEQFVWTLKWTHIHLFGMNMIFMFLGVVTLFLNINKVFRTWLIVLPFIGVLIDIAAMWLKGYISPAFFWLHIPGGGLFGLVFIYVCVRALLEMWFLRKNYAPE